MVQKTSQHASAGDRTEPHQTTEPAAATRVAAGSSEITPVTETGLVAGAGREQPTFRAGNPGVAAACDAQCDALSADRVELLARAVILVAGMAIPEAARKAVLARVVADLAAAGTSG
jgi:hypothetical protein